ncbi:MAG: M64 family metallopeptidase [Bacteroidota bacterium]
MICKNIRTNCIAFSFAICLHIAVSQESIQQLLENGPTEKRINIVFLSEGYTALQLTQYIVDATNDLNSFLNTPPNSSYKNFFNAFAISVASTDSGSDHPSRNVFRNTYFNSTFDTYGIARLVSIDGEGANKVQTLLQSLMPDYDIVIIIVNDLEYGGSGGTFAITSINSSALETVVHELGHSFAGLGDEYSSPYPGYPDTEEPNTTKETVREKIKWNSWISNTTPLPTPKTSQYGSVVGLFEGAHYQSSGWFRPKLNCKMQTLGVKFCEVCSETFIKSFYRLLRPIESFSPVNPSISISDTQSVLLSISNIKPAGSGIKTEWFIDGIKNNGEKGSTVSVSGNDLGIGQHTVYCIVRDTTPLVRNDPNNLLRDSVLWNISVSGLAAVNNNHGHDFPSQYFLEQNYPNPFNPSTTIAFTLPSPSFVTLTIYDVLGKKIETLIAQEMSSGRFTQTWNASTVSGGIYFCEFRAGSYSNIIKLALIK